MITIDRFLSDPDTAESALFNADVMFTFIPPQFLYISYLHIQYFLNVPASFWSIHDVNNDHIESLSISLFLFFHLLLPLTFFCSGDFSHRKWFYHFIYIFHSFPVYTTFVSVYLEYVDEDNSFGRKTNQYN